MTESSPAVTAKRTASRVAKRVSADPRFVETLAAEIFLRLVRKVVLVAFMAFWI
jgi:hypothetical protein